MPLYKCELCLFSSILKGDYKRHLNCKKHLRNIEGSLSDMVKSTKEHKKSTKEHKKSTKEHKKTHTCDYCENKFTTFANKRRHELHYCNDNPDIIDKIISAKDKKIKKLEKEKKKMGKEIEKLLHSVGNVMNSNNNSNNTNNINSNVIIVNNYGKENTDYLNPDYLKSLLNKPYGAIQDLIKKIHFHPKHPENHNVKITNKKLPHALVWNDKIWETRSKKEVINDLVDKGYFIMDTTNEDEDNKRYNNFQNKYEEGETKDYIEKDTELLLLNETKKMDLIDDEEVLGMSEC